MMVNRAAPYLLRKLSALRFRVGTGLRGVAVVVRNNSAELFFPFDFAFGRRCEIRSKHLVSDIHALMRTMVVIVRQPFAIDVVQLLHAEAEKVVKALFFNFPDVTFAKCICLRSTYRSFMAFHTLAFPKCIKTCGEFSVAVTEQTGRFNSDILQPH